ncbi:hypothetical protein AB837_00075 [bacterium AB1]|nr:hypothetical protein AB837_00075 [bacterium AB1]
MIPIANLYSILHFGKLVIFQTNANSELDDNYISQEEINELEGFNVHDLICHIEEIMKHSSGRTSTLVKIEILKNKLNIPEEVSNQIHELYKNLLKPRHVQGTLILTKEKSEVMTNLLKLDTGLPENDITKIMQTIQKIVDTMKPHVSSFGDLTNYQIYISSLCYIGEIDIPVCKMPLLAESV